jgi:hypothetical protein
VAEMLWAGLLMLPDAAMLPIRTPLMPGIWCIGMQRTSEETAGGLGRGGGRGRRARGHHTERRGRRCDASAAGKWVKVRWRRRGALVPE